MRPPIVYTVPQKYLIVFDYSWWLYTSQEVENDIGIIGILLILLFP